MLPAALPTPPLSPKPPPLTSSFQAHGLSWGPPYHVMREASDLHEMQGPRPCQPSRGTVSPRRPHVPGAVHPHSRRLPHRPSAARRGGQCGPTQPPSCPVAGGGSVRKGARIHAGRRPPPRARRGVGRAGWPGGGRARCPHYRLTPVPSFASFRSRHERVCWVCPQPQEPPPGARGAHARPGPAPGGRGHGQRLEWK